ncbi:hypothetical protein Pedsa_2845 [Pseudopedobacter saltans DSM 12145]|uniref:Uncharacterized protein n=1 Tax=Pseudopedobacter saltans (strain ATCC 51119 / DSM 12145 / JCM 21818 / CCUG 39354 / LMG 10337 / NBRC 100064 / NCIMB 13643) TaxID=762903 RepID=F0S8C0_PSESL|nr:hypothetical protein [Pseudopedobacter saltans]ADY53384.1 hypothetical protein Pedsa_2845 [Pseudopedobacter saltans DSM 12145]
MKLKDIVDELLRERERSLSWLAQQVGKTFDGFRLSLIKESIKYTDLRRMAEVLEVPPSVLFISDIKYLKKKEDLKILEDQETSYTRLSADEEMQKEFIESLKNQIKDKNRIIELLSKKNS